MATFYISGPDTLPEADFGRHYVPKLEALYPSDRVVVGNETVTDYLALCWLDLHAPCQVAVYPSLQMNVPRSFQPLGVVLPYRSCVELMLKNSDADIIWAGEKTPACIRKNTLRRALLKAPAGHIPVETILPHVSVLDFGKVEVRLLQKDKGWIISRKDTGAFYDPETETWVRNPQKDKYKLCLPELKDALLAATEGIIS